MSRPISLRFNSFLDRFEERLEVDCDRMKRELVARVDQQFGVLRTKISELRGRFGGGRADRDAVSSLYLDDPQMETVSLDKWILERSPESRNEPSTSSGHKRKSTAYRSSKSDKRQKTVTTGRKKFACKYADCGKIFTRDAELARHERIHLGIEPFSCSWPNCRFSSETRNNVVRHVRTRHFKLPKTVTEQNRLEIVDNRDPNEFVRVDTQLEQRRLE